MCAFPAAGEHFISRVFDVARPFSSFLGTGFAVENRPSEPQAAHAMAEYLRGRAARKEAFLTTVSEFHLLVFLTNMLVRLRRTQPTGAAALRRRA